MIVYGDTSALAKLLLEEDGSAEMQGLYRRAEITTAVVLAYVELRSALAAAIRSGRVPSPRRDALVAELEALWSGVSTIGVDESLLRQAGDLAERMGLRSYDAMHLAALVQINHPEDLVFACWDAELRAAARALGYQVLPA